MASLVSSSVRQWLPRLPETPCWFLAAQSYERFHVTHLLCPIFSSLLRSINIHIHQLLFYGTLLIFLNLLRTFPNLNFLGLRCIFCPALWPTRDFRSCSFFILEPMPEHLTSSMCFYMCLWPHSDARRICVYRRETQGPGLQSPCSHHSLLVALNPLHDPPSPTLKTTRN